MPAMMLMIAKMIDQPFDAASPSVESDDDALDDPHDADEDADEDREPRGRLLQVHERDDAGDDEQDAERDVADARPAALVLGEDAEAGVDEAGGDGVDRDDRR